MGFPHKGENHYSGINNEKEIVKYQNNNINNEINTFLKKKFNLPELIGWKHVGGTQHKEDCIVMMEDTPCAKISIKNHSQGRTSTFDWLNTSKLPDCIQSSVKLNILEFKEKYNKQEVTKEMRCEMEEILSNQLDILDGLNVKMLFQSFYEKCPEWIMINMCKNNQFVFYHKSELKYFYNNKYSFKFKKTRAKTSRQLYIIDENHNEINVHIRIRLVLNNGLNALLDNGNSKSKVSYPCIKIQQECIDKMVDSIENKVITSYK